MRLLIVFAGGGLGAVARFVFGAWVQKLGGSHFPWGTLAVNTLGCFLIGLVVQIWIVTGSMSEEWRLALITGFLGGFTTYSAFNYETMLLAQQGRWELAALNVTATLLICFLAGGLGMIAGRIF